MIYKLNSGLERVTDTEPGEVTVAATWCPIPAFKCRLQALFTPYLILSWGVRITAPFYKFRH